ncbi:MAG TPA: ATP-binding protein [Candidatus Limnocylindria bacterium]|jgi:anti-sigma regulatory factor (Ser/Thr protein kinase)|nr:ATP-binding protein [Candidatus Limnocylindria bacterium]
MGVRTDWSLVRSDAAEALHARDAIKSFLREQADPSSDLDAVEVIVGELVANVIRHAPGPIGIYVAWEDEGATLIVADRGRGIPTLRSVPTDTSERGRGLFLVEALSRGVSISATPGNGSRVIVDLPVQRRRADAFPDSLRSTHAERRV